LQVAILEVHADGSVTYLNCCEIGDACTYHSHDSTLMFPGSLVPRLVGGAWMQG